MSPTAPLPDPGDLGATASPAGPSSWGGLVDSSLRERAKISSTSEWILRSEFQPQTFCRYAAGKANDPERLNMESYLARTPWAMQRLSTLIRQSRPESKTPLATQLLRAAEQGDVNPYRTAALALLDTLAEELPQAVKDLRESACIQGSPAVRAAYMLSRGRLPEAREAFSKLDSEPTPLLELATKLAGVEDKQEALLTLLLAL